MRTPDPLAPDLLIGLAPAAAGACRRCGTSTRALANGRGRLDICGACGTVEVQSSEGLDLWSLRGAGYTPTGSAKTAPSPTTPKGRRDDPYRLR